jgi:hypothetical protein
MPTSRPSASRRGGAPRPDRVVVEHDEIAHREVPGRRGALDRGDPRRIRKATIAGFVPVLCGASFKNKGVQALLDAVIDFLPSPHDVPAIEGHAAPRPSTTRATVRRRRAVRGAGVQDHDRPVRRTADLLPRVLGQVLKPGELRLQRDEGQARAHRPPAADARQQARGDPGVRAGDIAAAIGLKDTRTGDTLCDEDKPIILEAMKFPTPVIDVAVEPKTKADQDKLGIALRSCSEEDPTFRVRTDAETSQTIISGMGELHLEIIVDRMKREFKVEANVGRRRSPTARRSSKRRRRSRASSSGSRAARASTATWSSNSSRRSPAGLRLRGQDRRRRDPQGVHQAGRGGHPRGAGERRPRRLPDGRREGRAGLRQLPRRRLERDGVQDRRLDGVQGRRRRRRPRSSSSR